MKTPHTDTHPNAEHLHMEMLRKAPLFRRLQMVASLVKTTYQLSWMELCEHYPNETVEARMERFIFYLYGDKSLASSSFGVPRAAMDVDLSAKKALDKAKVSL